MEDYEKKYKEVLKKIREGLQPSPDGTKISGVTRAFLEEVFSELAESKDEKIRKNIIKYLAFLKDRDGSYMPQNESSIDDMIAWLEKQSQTFTKKDVDDAYLKGIFDAKHELEKQSEQKPTSDTRYEGKAGDSLSVNGKPFDYEKATITQKDFAPKDYHDIDPHFGIPIEDLMSRKNPVDKVEPKFKTGQWIVWQDKYYKVNYNGCGYELIDQNGLSTSLEYGTVDENAHLWDVTKDAKDGDVLISQYGKPLIYNGNYNSLNIGAYCGISCDDNFRVAVEKCYWTENEDIKPSTKEQRNTLMKAMEDAGYEWDAEKKELKKVEKKQEWSEEDKEMFEQVEESLDYYRTKVMCDKDYALADIVTKEISWLKSLKDRVQPQPKKWSEEDEEMANDLIEGCLTSEKTHHLVHTSKEIADWLKSLKSKLQR